MVTMKTLTCAFLSCILAAGARELSKVPSGELIKRM